MPTDGPTTEKREKILVLCDLIESEMELESGVVSPYNTRRTLKPRRGLYVDVSLVASKVFGNSARSEDQPGTSNLTEIRSLNVQETYQIDIFSADESARERRAEIVFALTGEAAQQAQEAHGFKIAEVPSSFVDLSGLDGPARLNRFAITINLLTAHRQTKTRVPYTVFQNPPKKIIVNP